MEEADLFARCLSWARNQPTSPFSFAQLVKKNHELSGAEPAEFLARDSPEYWARLGQYP
jgi:hypothetical protein